MIRSSKLGTCGQRPWRQSQPGDGTCPQMLHVTAGSAPVLVFLVPIFLLLRMLAIYYIRLLANILTCTGLVCNYFGHSRHSMGFVFQSGMIVWPTQLALNQVCEIPSARNNVWNKWNVSRTVSLFQQGASFSKILCPNTIFFITLWSSHCGFVHGHD
jgi:hypothetical protein